MKNYQIHKYKTSFLSHPPGVKSKQKYYHYRNYLPHEKFRLKGKVLYYVKKLPAVC